MGHTYEELLHLVLNEGALKPDRTGVGTISITGGQIRYDLQKGFPLITSKRVFVRGVLEELLWFVRGSTNARELSDRGVHIWDAWADPETGELGPVYGKQWRAWAGPDGRTYDQLTQAIEMLRQDPFSRRIIVNAWNVAELDQMALPPCHVMFQFIARGHSLDCVVTQRSADLFLGVPFDLASFAFLTQMVAQQTSLLPGELIWNGGDCHIYLNHAGQAQTLLGRSPKPLPQVNLASRLDISDYRVEDFSIIGYDPHPAIHAPVAV